MAFGATIILIIILIIGSAVVDEFFPDSAIPSTSNTNEKDLAKIARDIHELVNEERVSRGIDPLVWNSQIAEIALLHSQDMARNNYYEHVNLQGQDPTSRGIEEGYYCEKIIGAYIYSGLSENLMWMDGYARNAIAKESIEGWLLSTEGHKENMLDTRKLYSGVGVAMADNGEIYVTHNFALCKP